jgi:hypothetical protein
MSCRWHRLSWMRRQWTAVSEKPWNGVRVSHNATHVKKISMSETIGVTRKDDVWCWASDLMVVAQFCGWNKQRMCVHKNTLSLIVCTSRVKPIFFKKISDLLYIINSLIGMFRYNC